MRWPIHVQLLLPMLFVAVLAIALTSVTSAYVGADNVRRQQEESLRRVVTTLVQAAFPLSDRVLRQMSGLSGAEFILLDDQGRVEASTLKPTGDELATLEALPAEESLAGVSTNHMIEVQGDSYLGHRVPVARRLYATGTGSLVVLYHEERWRAEIRRAAYPAIIAGGMATIVALIAASLLARRFVRPIQQLDEETARIAEGRFQPLAVPSRNDELRDLALSVNSMAERLNKYASDVRSNERLRTLGQLGTAVAHQLRNSATGARMAIELHKRECAAGAPESIEVAIRQLRLMESYLQRFLRLGRQRSLVLNNLDLGELVESVLELVRPGCVHGGVDLRFQPGAQRYVVCGDADALRDMLMNVVLNAIEAAKRPGDARPRVVVELERLGQERAVIRVKDSGAGPSDAVRGDLFQPLASEKPEGAGLGLYVARQVAEAHQGVIDWQRIDNMTCFWIEIPLVRESAEDGSPADR